MTPVRVAFQGGDYAYSHLAAQKYLDDLDVPGRLEGHRSFREAVAALLDRAADLAVLPIENTTAGSINEVYDLLREHPLWIVGEETWRVDHCLAAPEDVPLERIGRVLSHPQALAQCARFLQSLPQCTALSYFDTAEALRAVAAAADPTVAAIGSPQAAAAYGLTVLRRDVADQRENWTRFVVLARDAAVVDVATPAKTSLVLVTGDEEGALLRCLQVLAAYGLSMTKLESRPLPGRPWEYLFFLDFAGTVADPRVAAAVEGLRGCTHELKLLGSYPAKTTARA